MEIPTLTTARLTLRPFAPNDFKPYADMMAEPSVARFLTMTGEPLAATDAWRAMAMLAGCWALRGFGSWAVEERETRAFVGYVGPWQPEGWPGFEIGWGVAPAFQGRGYATEAARAAVAWSRDVLGVGRIHHIIAPANEASKAVARKLGARVVDHWTAPWSPPDMELWATDA